MTATTAHPSPPSLQHFSTLTEGNSRGPSPLFDALMSGRKQRASGLSKYPPSSGLANSKWSHSTSSLASHVRSGSDGYANVNTKLSENLHQIFHPHSVNGQQPPLITKGSSMHGVPKLKQPISIVPVLKSQISDPNPEPRPKPKQLSKSATTSAMLIARQNAIRFDILSQMAIKKYKEFLQQPQLSHNLVSVWKPSKHCPANRPKYYQNLLSGHFSINPKLSRQGSLSKPSPIKEFRRLKRFTKRQYQGKFNILLARKLGLRKESPRRTSRPATNILKYPPVSFSRQNSNEDYGPQSKWQSMDNIFMSAKLGKESRKSHKSNLALAQKHALPPVPPIKQMGTQLTNSLFGGSCGNIYERAKRRHSGFEQPKALFSPAYNHTIIGVESIGGKIISGFKSPRPFLGIGDFDLPCDDLQPIRDEGGFSDVGVEGTFEDCDEDGDTEEECAMDFESESLVSQSSDEAASGVNEYRYRNNRPLTRNPLYISDSSSSYGSVDPVREAQRSKKSKRGYKRVLVPFRPELPSSRRSSGTDLELSQRQRQGQFKNLGKFAHLPPKWSPLSGTLGATSSKEKKRSTKNKSRRDRGDVYETLNEELAMYRQHYERDRSMGSSRNKSSSTVPHSRTGSPCSVNSLHMTTRSNTPTHFPMHFHPIHPAVGSVRKQPPPQPPRELPPLQRVVAGRGAVTRAGGTVCQLSAAAVVAAAGASSGGVGGSVASNMPEQKLSVRIPI